MKSGITEHYAHADPVDVLAVTSLRVAVDEVFKWSLPLLWPPDFLIYALNGSQA